MWDILKNPKKQIIIIIIAVVGYWSWDILLSEKHVPIEYEYKAIQDTTIVETLSEAYQMERESRDSPARDRSPASVDSMESPSDYEFKIQFWDMVLGHLSSILGSITALLTPLITVYLNKKGYFNPSENEET